MGRGNCCVHREYEGLFFVDWNNFSSEWEDENGNIITDDYDFQRDEWEESLYQFISDFKKKYPSFSECDKWINREEKAILENELFYIVTEDNEWSMAIKLIQKEQDYYKNGNIEALQKKHYNNYLEGIKKCLFNQFEEIGTYCGAWTSGRIKRQ
jgi:hypothetical protein